ncbi:hypercellular protein-like protein HypA [Aureobasidium pullulans]|uniref:Hypercellular protein-like protein HypA n=1 Tax=Aureobasidium pullulans TaxID=5580 RepID=A0A4S9VV32_AURPU|nr:hypercellular protein-like protein HypA [Aureobasidium pullulans]THZ38222.1 hypercellular protein-like protein HypA [Aureobasidium pullulans]THZ56354.1 hypercellular protein-like protein HypA [Aureobasidium pullulans]THZ81969.1 hypercellular protein-like protein HypA [Aureobasidium pullulans]
MSNDPLSPIAPARVRVLVLPAGRIKKQRFVTFLDRLHQHDSVRLGDISPDGRSSKTIFSPLAFPNGSLLYNFSTSMAPPSHTQLAPFDLFREPMMVLGIADALEYESSPKDELQEVADKLAEQFPKILVSQLLVMDCTAEQQESWSLDSAICVPPSHATKTTTMNTIMCDISAKLLSEMGTYATAVQALPSVQSPGAAARPSDSRPHLDRSLSLASRPESPADPSAVLSPSDTHPSRGPPTNFDEMGAHTRSDSGKMANRDRMSVQAFGSTSAQEKAKNKGKARVGIVVGNLYMLAGRWNDAWRELVENTNKARTATDYLWYAKGLESIVVCMLLLIWSGFDFPIPAICNSGPDRSSSLISSAITRDGVPPIGQQEPAAAKQAASRASRLLPDLVPMIISIYERTNTLAGEPMSPVAYSETVLRMSKLLAFLQNAGGELDSTVLQKIASTSSRSLYQPKVNAGLSGGISKHAIADMALRAYPPPSAGVILADTIAIQSGIVSILSMLGLERKKAVIVKEMITLLVPALVQARKVGAAEMGIHPAASLSAAFGPGIPSAATNDEQVGLGNLLRDLHATYGARDRNHLDLTKGASDAGQENAVDVLINATIALTTQSAGTKSFGSINLKIDILRACIDFCEALPDLPGVVHFSALLLRVVGPQGTMTAHEQNRRVTLVTEEQLRLISNMSRTINAANKIGLPDVRALYWDDFLVRDVQWIDDTNNEKLRERHKSDLLFDSGNEPGKSPFLYNPFVKETHKTEDKIVVVGEPAELVITLQNPYGFEVRIDRLSLVTDGPAIEVDEHPITLGPARLQDVVVTARAKDEGQIKILGCSVHVYGCKDQVFPIYQSPWKPDFPSKVKELGLSARDPASATRARSSKGRSSNPVLPQPTTVSAVAIQAQPHVVLEKLNLSESALMVLEGQKKTFQITLRNTSAHIAVDFLHISFDDSLTSSIHTALAAKELTKPDMYGLELELSNNPTFSWIRSGGGQNMTIPPGEKATFEITVLGKPGLAAAKVMFDYAHLGKPFAEVEGRAFTRQVAVPIDITVNASIQLHRIDFSNFPADYAWTNRGLQEQGQRPKTPRSPSHPVEKGSDRFRTLLDRVGLESSNEEHCLLLLDLRNSWPNPLTVSVQVRSSSADESWNRAYTVHEVVHPGHIARLVLLLPRLHIANPYAPIPILSQQNQRQFVVSADGPVSADLERATREKFWFREEVLKYLRGTWEEKGSDRCGNIDLRGLRMSPEMIDTIRLQDIDVRMTIVPTESEEVQQTGRSKFVVTAESLLTLQTTIHNRSNGTIQALLRLQPTLADQSNSETSLDISRRLLISGTLQQCTPILSPNSSVTLELGICPLVSGEFDISALVEEVTLPTFEVKEIGEVETEDFEAGKEGLARKERRVWRGEEGCSIIVV